MVGLRLLTPASRLLPSTLPSGAPRTSLARTSQTFTSRTKIPIASSRRRYATPSGVKEVAVRDALNEALAEELESNNKVFVLGEEVAQYNGAYVQYRYNFQLEDSCFVTDHVTAPALPPADTRSRTDTKSPRVFWTASARRGSSIVQLPSRFLWSDRWCCVSWPTSSGKVIS